MTTLSLHITSTGTSLALADEWGGISPLLAEASFQRDGFAVLANFAQQAGLGCVGRNAEAMTMASGSSGPPVRLTLAPAAQGHEGVAPVLAAASAELRRKRLTVSRVLLATHDDPEASEVDAEVLAARTAGWCAPLCLPRAACIAVDAVPATDAKPLLVLYVGYADVCLTELQPDSGVPACRVLAIRQAGGVAALCASLTEELQAQCAGQAISADQARCEAQRFAREMLARSLQRVPEVSVPRLAFSNEGVEIVQHPSAPWTARFEAWSQELVQWLAPFSAVYDTGVLWVQDLGAPALAPALLSRLQGAGAGKWQLGLDPAVGAARLAASAADLKAISRRYARLPAMAAWDYGVLRPNGQGGTDFKALGKVASLAVQQKLMLKTTREDQMRMVLPIGIQQEGQPHQTLGILEFPLAAPATKGVVVEFYIELADPLLRVRGVAGQAVCPVGEAFLPLNEGLADAAAAYRSYASQLGAVI